MQFVPYSIVNITASTTIDIKIELNHLNQSFKNSEFNPAYYHALKYKIKKPKATILVIKSGKIIICGVKFLNEINDVRNIFFEDLKRIGYNPSYNPIKILNIVVLATLQLNNSLEKIICMLDSRKASFELEQFPGLIYKDWGLTFLLFSSGKVIITGVKDLDNMKYALDDFIKLINK